MRLDREEDDLGVVSSLLSAVSLPQLTSAIISPCWAPRDVYLKYLQTIGPSIVTRARVAMNSPPLHASASYEYVLPRHLFLGFCAGWLAGWLEEWKLRSVLRGRAGEGDLCATAGVLRVKDPRAPEDEPLDLCGEAHGECVCPYGKNGRQARADA